jgi:hypothetical protein
MRGMRIGYPRAVLMSGDTATYALSGQDASVLRGTMVAAAQGSYATTGQDATLTSSGPPSGDPYPHYQAFDRNIVPWHTAAGSYGPQTVLESPTLPQNITTFVTVNTQGEFNSAAFTPNSQITVGTSISRDSTLTIGSSDIDVIIPSGITVGTIEIGWNPRTTPIARVRIRGSTPYVRSGGKVGQFRAVPASPNVDPTDSIFTDIVVDGLDFDGYSSLEPRQNFYLYGRRIAVVNCRAIAANINWLGISSHLVIANCNFAASQVAYSETGQNEGWSFRSYGGPVTLIDSRFQSPRFTTIRLASRDYSGEQLYIGRCTIVSVAEGRTAWFWSNLGGSEGYPTNCKGEAGIITNCNIYAYAESIWPAEIATYDTDFSTISNNNFYSGGNAVWTQGLVDANVLGGGVGTGNTFNALNPTLPAWTGPGDPRDIPLPYGHTLVTGSVYLPTSTPLPAGAT